MQLSYTTGFRGSSGLVQIVQNVVVPREEEEEQLPSRPTVDHVHEPAASPAVQRPVQSSSAAPPEARARGKERKTHSDVGQIFKSLKVMFSCWQLKDKVHAIHREH